MGLQYWGVIVISDNGKGNGNYYLGFTVGFRVHRVPRKVL